MYRHTIGCSTPPASTPPPGNSPSVVKRIVSPGAMRSSMPNFSNTTRSSSRCSTSMIFQDTPHISATCGRRSTTPAAVPDRRWFFKEALAQSSMFTRGHTDRTRAEFERGRALAEAFQDQARQLRLLAGLNISFLRRGDIRGALAVAEQAGVIAQAAKQPAGTRLGGVLVGHCPSLSGQIQATAQRHCRAQHWHSRSSLVQLQ